jgi:hypothetical protein
LRHVKSALERRLDFARRQLVELIPADTAWILVDEDQLRGDLPHAHVIPFLEEAGEYCGPPEDDETAIREFERLRQAGARFMVFAWPAFWWLEHYAGLRRHLQTRFRCVLKDEHFTVYDLQAGPCAAAATNEP